MRARKSFTTHKKRAGTQAEPADLPKELAENLANLAKLTNLARDARSDQKISRQSCERKRATRRKLVKVE